MGICYVKVGVLILINEPKSPPTHTQSLKVFVNVEYSYTDITPRSTPTRSGISCQIHIYGLNRGI